jgi:hypothetical protein
MIFNTFTDRAVVLFDGVYRAVLGSQQKNYDFVFLLNGRIESVPDGHWIDIRHEKIDSQIERTTIAYNIDYLKRHRCTKKY